MEQPSQVPAQIKDAAPRPQGLLPKNVQSWLLAGLACLMVAIMWLTGGKKPETPAKTTAVPALSQAPAEVSQTKINELQNRIEQLQRQQLIAQNALEQQTRLLSGSTPEPQQVQSPPPGSVSTQRPEDQIGAQAKARSYQSLFASNVALTYRKPVENPTVSPAITETPQDDQPTSQLLNQLLQDQPPAAQNTPTAPVERTKTATAPQVHPKDDKSQAAPSDQVEGQTYLLSEGTILEAVLINRLDGQFAGPVECLISTDVYASDRQHLLVPAGTKLLGETKKVDTFGQTRLAVVFHRLLMPDGYSASLDQFAGLNQLGDTALQDQVDNHYRRIFGVSLAIGAIGALAGPGTADSLSANSTDLMRQAFAASTAQSSAQILDKFLNIMPSVTIREGHRIKVYLSGDLALPDYNHHRISPDF